MTIGLTWRRTARRIKRLKDGVLTISPDYSDRPTPDFLALSREGTVTVEFDLVDPIAGTYGINELRLHWLHKVRQPG
jgi:hypothetical protein